MIASSKKKILKILPDFETCAVLSMSMLFLVSICISVLSEGVVRASKSEEDLTFYNLVKEGQFTMKCEEMYGEPVRINETENPEIFYSYNCDEDCEECLQPLRFESTKHRTYNECKAECDKNGLGDACKQGCYFLHRFVNSGNGPSGIWYDTRNVTAKGPYLFCRTYTELVVNFDFRLLSDNTAKVEPTTFISFYRLNEKDPWTMLSSVSSELPFYFPDLFKGFTIQISIAIVTAKGLQVKLPFKEFRHVGEWMVTLSDEVHLDPPKGLQAHVRKAGDRFEGHLTWYLAPRSKICDYRIEWRATYSDHWKSEAFEVSHSKHVASTRMYYIVEGLLPMENYTIEVISVASGEKQNKTTICIVTPSLVLGPPENLTLVHLTHLSLNTSTATVTWWPPHNIPIVDHVQEYRLEWNKIPVLNGVFTEPHFDSTWLPAENTSFRVFGLHNGFAYMFKVAAVSSVTGVGTEAVILFNTTETTTKVSSHEDQHVPVLESKALPWMFITGILVAIVCASFVRLSYAFVKKKYGSLSLAVEQFRARCRRERETIINLI